MKQAIKITLCIVLFAGLAASTVLAQEYARLERQKTIAMDGESTKTEVTIEANDEYNFLSIAIKSSLNEGSALIELLNPDGKVMGNYTIKTDTKVKMGSKTKIYEEVNGEMRKSFRNPKHGDWIIRISPKQAKGRIVINSSQVFNARADVLPAAEIEKTLKTNYRKSAESETIK